MKSEKRKMKITIIILTLCMAIFATASMCPTQNDVAPNTAIETKSFDKKLKINISGYYIAWSKVNYEYTIKNIENEYLLLVTIESGGTYKILYEKTLTNDEIDRIFSFIDEHDIENMLVDSDTQSSDIKWVSPHDFRGSIIIHIDDKAFENTINSSQKFETNLYAVLNFLNDHIDDKEYFMPISGVIHRSESKVVQ